MYTSDEFQIRDEETFTLRIPSDRDYKILQLTDLHLGFGIFSGKKDRLALAAVTELIRRTKPDLLVLTGDSVFPFFPRRSCWSFWIVFRSRIHLYLGIMIVRWGLPAIRSSFRTFLPRAKTRSLPKADMSEARLLFLAWGILCWIW